MTQTPAGPALRGTVTDPSGALVPGALVQLRGPAGDQRKTTGDAESKDHVIGRHVFSS